MAAQDPIDVFPDSWIQIGGLLPVSSHPETKMRRRPKPKLNRRQRSVASKTMVKTAIKTLMRNPRAGVSFMAIRKYIEENYYQNSFSHANKRFSFVKRYIRNSLEKGELIRTKGTGVSGSFRLPFTKRILKKKSNNKKGNINKRKRNIRNAKDIRRKVRKQLKEMEMNGRSRDGQFSGENAVDATLCNIKDPKQPIDNVMSKLNVT
ncbi:histone H1A, sperm [Bactrocera oleae]|uniref:histone H1A, sperm n=1 Tax=Bactrocera oleae TaxID=104688 RepID=UPI00387EBA59